MREFTSVMPQGVSSGLQGEILYTNKGKTLEEIERERTSIAEKIMFMESRLSLKRMYYDDGTLMPIKEFHLVRAALLDEKAKLVKRLRYLKIRKKQINNGNRPNYNSQEEMLNEIVNDLSKIQESIYHLKDKIEMVLGIR